MFLTKLVTLALVLSVSFALTADELFAKDSEFMVGFESGMIMRQKGGNIDEYGCQLPEGGSRSMNNAFSMIKNGIKTATATVPLDPIITGALDIVTDFLDGLQVFFAILSPKHHSSTEKMDQYCTGLVFGYEGSKMLVKVSNTLIDKDGNTTISKKNIIPDSIFHKMGGMYEGLLNTAKASVKQMSDEL